MSRRLLVLLAICWASPWTMVGVLFGLLGLLTGGGAVRRGRVVEFWGGSTVWLLRRMPLPRGASAITLGHSVLARTTGDLERARAHELVHVRQYERWGPLFVPAYFLSSLAVWLQGRHPYLDNAFEREAYGNANGPGRDVS